MKKRLLLLLAVSFTVTHLFAQPFVKAANDAYLVTRMVDKFHFQPRVLNDQFSADIFSKFLNALDGERIFFTAPDIALLSGYKYQLDDQIKYKRIDFLQAAASIYQKRLLQVQSIIDKVCKSPFNFYFAEKFTVAEDTSYPANAAAQQIKIYKIVSFALLNTLVKNNNEIIALNVAEQKKYVQKNEPQMRAKIQNAFKRSINRVLQSPGGLQKILGDEYCKSIAQCYDPHTEYLPSTQKEKLETELGDREIGLGFSLKTDGKGNAFINDLKPGSPAYKSGQINRGDKIISIQWEGNGIIDLTGATVKEITDAINTSNYGKIIISLKKADGSKRNVTLSKEKIEEDLEENKVKSFLLKGDKAIGYISLPAFYEDWENEKGINGCANDVAKEIIKLKQENIKGLILDVRFNSGGSLQEAIELAGIFIDGGPVAQYRTRSNEIITLKDTNKGVVYDGPLLLLVNGYSASASEMFAAALQDYNRAVIAGSPTYGKSTTQIILPLDTTITPQGDLTKSKADAYIKITIAEIYRLTGKSLQGVGVTPDVLIPEIGAQKEKDNVFAFSAHSIAANKYYQPFPQMAIKNLNSVAKKEIAASAYFKEVEKDAEIEKKSQQKTDVSLQLYDALALQKNSMPKMNAAENNIFKVDNHAYDNKRLIQNKVLYEVNEEWRKHISEDAYIKLAYALMDEMIKQ
jgi:carboxyl-terminal processing protease